MGWLVQLLKKWVRAKFYFLSDAMDFNSTQQSSYKLVFSVKFISYPLNNAGKYHILKL